MRKNKKILFSILVIVVLAILSIFVFLFRDKKSNRNNKINLSYTKQENRFDDEPSNIISSQQSSSEINTEGNGEISKEVSEKIDKVTYKIEGNDENQKCEYIKLTSTITGEYPYYIVGDYSAVIVSGKGNGIDIAQVEIMFLKTYSKKSIENNTAKLTIKGKEISLKKNEKFKVYEDNDVVIYDILELATGKTAESYIKQRAKEESITSSDYILNVRKQVLSELKNK